MLVRSIVLKRISFLSSLLINSIFLMWYIYTMEYYSARKKEQNWAIVKMWMDLESTIQSKVSQKEKNKYCILMHIREI